ncbi:hypothetical protein TNIN_302371 [Trichonephila inaurata madagascariensis]|uniref:Uncharacterized protein n=1 Tax=Trichonephila inaurata madagascariensis TaxID=2747483 RepID=A0A8X6YQS9_9ARAC|nr:hypothetical protein TNIN_302371 [Trichonephila inaurata madagascariensis]
MDKFFSSLPAPIDALRVPALASSPDLPVSDSTEDPIAASFMPQTPAKSGYCTSRFQGLDINQIGHAFRELSSPDGLISEVDDAGLRSVTAKKKRFALDLNLMVEILNWAFARDAGGLETFISNIFRGGNISLPLRMVPVLFYKSFLFLLHNVISYLCSRFIQRGLAICHLQSPLKSTVTQPQLNPVAAASVSQPTPFRADVASPSQVHLFLQPQPLLFCHQQFSIRSLAMRTHRYSVASQLKKVAFCKPSNLSAVPVTENRSDPLLSASRPVVLETDLPSGVSPAVIGDATYTVTGAPEAKLSKSQKDWIEKFSAASTDTMHCVMNSPMQSSINMSLNPLVDDALANLVTLTEKKIAGIAAQGLPGLDPFALNDSSDGDTLHQPSPGGPLVSFSPLVPASTDCLKSILHLQEFNWQKSEERRPSYSSSVPWENAALSLQLHLSQ